MAIEDLFGSWNLVSHQFVADGTDERRDNFGARPQGCLVISPDRRMMALITADDRHPADGALGDAALFKSMLAYGGTLRIEGADRFITRVDVSWQPAWVGTEQTRLYALQGDVLTLSTPEMEHPAFPGRKARGVLTWHRMSAF